MWCPKCKTEYRDGITVCADCGTELVEEIDNLIDVCEIKGEEAADEMVEFLRYSGIENVKKEWLEESERFRLLVKQTQAQRAEKLVHGYLLGKVEEKEAEENAGNFTEETASDGDGEDIESRKKNIWDTEPWGYNTDFSAFDGDSLFEEKVEDTVELLYTKEEKEFVKRSDKYRDVKFSGYTLILFGIIGGIYLALTQLKVIPLSYDLVVFCLLGVLFAAFFVAGVVSLVKASKIKKEIPQEEEEMDSINKWMDEHITAEQMAAWKDDTVSDMENDLLVTAKLCQYVVRNFPESDKGMIEKIVDEYYEEKFINE